MLSALRVPDCSLLSIFEQLVRVSSFKLLERVLGVLVCRRALHRRDIWCHAGFIDLFEVHGQVGTTSVF